MLELENLEEALASLGDVFQQRGVSMGVPVAGASSLLLLGLIDRPTADIDIIGLAVEGHYIKAEVMPVTLSEAVRDVGRALGLADTWPTTGRPA
jgi:hypothetical protein